MRTIAGVLFTVLFVGVLIAIGGGIYQAGVAQGIVDAGRVPAGAAVGMAGYGWGFHGFGFLGLILPILFLFLLFGLIRAAFGFGRGWGRRDRPGYGYGGWSRGGSMGGPGFGPEGWREERERRMAELHQRLHDEEAGKSSNPSATSSGS